VLALLVRRWTARETAEQLYLSERTIESHVASIYNKLGVSSRHDAITVAVSHALIELLAPNPTT
jgi:DNA-binding NarL/FixJ family response regulator